MKKQIEVKLFGLNEFGVSELNEFYKLNIAKGWCNVFKVGDNEGNIKRKRFKNSNLFYRDGLDNYICNVDCTQVRTDGLPGHGPMFSLQIKHFVHEIFEVEVTEKFTQINLA
jgi:hypothetical protein